MATNLTASISAGILATHTGTSLQSGIGSTTDTINRQFTATLAGAGGAANATGVADTIYSVSGTVSTGSPQTIVFGSGATVKDAFGATVPMARIKTIYLENTLTADSDATLALGGASAPIVSIFGSGTDKINVAPGGVLLLSAPLTTGYVLVNSTGDAIKLTNNTSGAVVVSYKLVIIGNAA